MAEYHELVFEGPLPVVRAFLVGIQLGKGWTTPILCSEDHHIHGDTIGHQLLEKIKLTKELTYVVALDRYVPAISEAVEASREMLGLVIRRDCAIHSAKFDYSFAVFNRKVAAGVRRRLQELEPGLVLTDVEDKEEVHPEGKGTEVYAPEHEFAYTGKGTVRGPLPALLDYRNALGRIRQVKLGLIRLVLR